MLAKWLSSRGTRFSASQLWARANAPIWNRVGPKWYASTWWHGESLASMQYALLSLLAIAHTERLEIKPLVMALAEEHRGRFRRQLRMLARRMEGNASLVDALEKTPDALNDNTVLALRFGSQSGTLAKTYEQLIENEKPNVNLAAIDRKNDRRYWGILAVSLLLIFQGMMYFIAPTFKKMMDEFEVPIPRALRALFATTEYTYAYFLYLMLACGVVSWFLRSTRVKRFIRRQIWDRLLRSNSLSISSHLFRMLAVAVEAGRPLPGSLSTLAKFHFDKKTRHKLLIARNEVEQGVPGWFSLVDAKLITPEEFQALNSAASNQVQSWSLRKMASLKQDQAESQADTRMSIIRPVVIFVFAAFVLWVSYAFFSVIADMIQRLA